MWIMLNDAFLSIVKKDCPPDHFLVRARRPGDIEKVFGRRIKVERLTDADYLFRARIPREDVEVALVRELGRVTYGNFKDTVKDHDLHTAYLRVWSAMASTQNPPPYSQRYRHLGGNSSYDDPMLEATRRTGSLFDSSYWDKPVATKSSDISKALTDSKIATELPKRPVSRPKKGPKK